MMEATKKILALLLVVVFLRELNVELHCFRYAVDQAFRSIEPIQQIFKILERQGRVVRSIISNIILTRVNTGSGYWVGSLTSFTFLISPGEALC